MKYTGDTDNKHYKVKKKIGEDEQGQPIYEEVDLSQYENIEVQFNNSNNYNSIKKLLSDGELSIEDNTILIHLSQEDTFKLGEGEYEVQIRLFNDDGDYAKATHKDNNNELKESLSHEVIE